MPERRKIAPARMQSPGTADRASVQDLIDDAKGKGSPLAPQRETNIFGIPKGEALSKRPQRRKVESK
jgi:hypothetical protein